MAILIPYAQRNGIVVHVADVPSGLACQCVCLNCGGELIARKGYIREEHFAHRSGQECAGAAEGVLHRLAKEILCSLDRFEVPAYHWERSRQLPFGGSVHHQRKLTPGGEIEVLHSIPEFRLPSNFVPDVVLFANSTHQSPKPLFIEIIVTHRINRLKQRKIRRFGVPTLEIHLEPQDLFLDPDELHEKIAGLSRAKKWSFHPSQIPHEKEFISDYRRQRQQGMVAKRASSVVDQSMWEDLRKAKKFLEIGKDDESNRAIKEFFKAHGRFPSVQETSILFRKLNKRE